MLLRLLSTTISMNGNSAPTVPKVPFWNTLGGWAYERGADHSSVGGSSSHHRHCSKYLLIPFHWLCSITLRYHPGSLCSWFCVTCLSLT